VTDGLQAALTFHRERHGVLAGNIANVDTPGYAPLDVVRTPAPVVPGGGASGPAFKTVSRTKVLVEEGNSKTMDGNSVELEREMAKLEANRVRYQTSAELVSRQLAMLRYAAGDGIA